MCFYYSVTLCELFNLGIISQEGKFYSTVKSYETPLKRRMKTKPRFLAHFTPTASESSDLSFVSEF